jgi:hypothetical protein
VGFSSFYREQIPLQQKNSKTRPTPYNTPVDQQNNQGLSGSTHLTTAEAGRLLGKSSAQIREMIRRGELTQEQLEGRWLIPFRDINKIVDPSFGEGDRKQRMAGNERRSKPGKKRHKGKLHEGESSRQRGTSKAPIVKKTRDLAGEVERLERKMKRIDDEIRDLRSGLMMRRGGTSRN